MVLECIDRVDFNKLIECWYTVPSQYRARSRDGPVLVMRDLLLDKTIRRQSGYRFWQTKMLILDADLPAYAREILSVIPLTDVEKTRMAEEAIQSASG